MMGWNTTGWDMMGPEGTESVMVRDLTYGRGRGGDIMAAGRT